MKIVSHSRFWPLASLALADLVVFTVTNPHSAASFWLIIGFLLFCVSFYYLVLALLKLGAWYGLPANHNKRLARTITGVVSGVVALQSVGELSIRDLIVLLPLALLAYLYISYNRATDTE